tara:strand:- start:2286 stop:4562 length:2277 start_codon:yes stop_codon:yes gene_type:complete
MKTQTIPERLAGGVDQRFKVTPDKASDIRNLRVEDTGLGWCNDRGWEPLHMLPDNGAYTFTGGVGDAKHPCRFLKVWSRHNGAEVYYLFERNGKLVYQFGNQGSAATGEVVLGENRYLPSANEPGTQLTPFGRFSVIHNGNDVPIKFWGREKTSQFHFTQPPNAPIAYKVDPRWIDSPNDIEGGATGLAIPAVGWQEGGTGTNHSSNTFDYTTLGLGPTTGNGTAHYRYKVTYVTDSGSESPLSEEEAVTWKIDNGVALQKGKKFCVFLGEISTGGNNVVARRIYRTKNINLDANDESFYFLKQIDDNVTTSYWDMIPDATLLSAAPVANASVIIPSSFKLSASWNGCLWVAGWDGNNTELRYSDRYKPEQFSRFRFFDVGARDGGAITALVPYYNSLIVFREKAIEVISAIADDEYTIGTISGQVGTTATNTIKEIPTVGLFFLTIDGVYALTGGQSGAGLVQSGLQPIAGNLHKEWRRMTEGALPRATACYSSKEKEYWVHYPVDGQTENSRGAVFHSMTGAWSLRNLPPQTIGSTGGHSMWFTQLDTNPEGWIVIGTYPNYPHPFPSDANFNAYPGFGLQVWSAYDAFGDDLTFTGTSQGNVSYNWTPHAKNTFETRYVSAWDDMGDDSVKKRIHSVEIDMVTFGYNDLTLNYESDYAFEETAGGTASPMLVEQYLTTGSEPAWYDGSSDVKKQAKWGDKWSGPQICRLRFDVHTGNIGAFRFILKSANQFQVISYQIEYSTSGQKVITRRGGSG